MTFVGRVGERARVAAALAEAAEGVARLVAVVGPAGIGKTRLAEEVAEQARRDGWQLVWLAARRSERGAGFRLWLRLARAAGRELPVGPGGDDYGGDEMADAVAVLITDLAATGPVLVVIDDLQDADTDSAAVLPPLLATLRDQPVALLVTVRVQPDTPPPSLRAHCLVPLDPLTPAETVTLLADVLPQPAANAAMLAERSGGNPLLALELAALGDRGGTDVPTSVARTVGAQLDALPAGARGFVEAGAVLGLEFDVTHVRAMVGTGPAEPAGALLVAVPGARLRYRFGHALVRDAVLSAMDAARRRDLHGRAAAVLDATGAPAAVVAEHRVAALSDGDDAAAAIAACERAAGQAEAARAWQAAREARQQVLALLEPGGDAAARAAAECALADAWLRLGATAQAREIYLQADRHARAAARPDLRARAALGLSGGAAGLEVPLHDHEALELLHEANDALRGEHSSDGLRALVLARLSVAETARRDPERRRRLAAEAVELGRAAGQPLAVAAALASWCDAEPGPQHAAARRVRAEEIVSLAGRARDADHLLLGLRLRLVAELEAGDTPAARASAAEFERTALRQRRDQQLFLAPLWRATFALADGDLAGARSLNARATAVGEAAGSSHAFALTVSQRAAIDMMCGAWDDVQRFLESALEQFPDLIGPRASLAWVLAHNGNLDRSTAMLTALTGDDCAAVVHDAEWLPTLALLADATALTGHVPAAEILLPLLAPYHDVFVVDGLGDAAFGVTAGFLAGLAEVIGDRVAAGRYWAEAVERNAAAGLTTPLLRVRAARAAAGHPDAGSAARELHRIEQEAAALGLALPPRPAASLGETARTEADWHLDGAVVRIEFAGRSAQVRAGKGTGVIAELLRRPNVHVPATTLDGRSVEQHDTGPALDDVAKRAYRRQLNMLEDRIDRAVLDGQDATALVAERDALVEELARAAGLRGRPRLLGSDAEKSRVNVTKAIGAVLRQLDDAHPAAAAHLRSALRTGRACAYLPDPAGGITWSVR